MCIRLNSRVSVCPAACGRRRGKASPALKNMSLCSIRYQTNRQQNASERPRTRLSTVSTVQNGLSTLRMWTLFINDDNDLRVILSFVHTVHTFLCRHPEETPARSPAKPARRVGVGGWAPPIWVLPSRLKVRVIRTALKRQCVYICFGEW